MRRVIQTGAVAVAVLVVQAQAGNVPDYMAVVLSLAFAAGVVIPLAVRWHAILTEPAVLLEVTGRTATTWDPVAASLTIRVEGVAFRTAASHVWVPAESVLFVEIWADDAELAGVRVVSHNQPDLSVIGSAVARPR